MTEPLIDKALAAAAAKLSDAAAFDAVVQFDMGDDGSIFVDGRETPPSVAAACADAPDCVISAPAEVFQEMMDGSLDPVSAFMGGRLSIDGDMGAAMKMAQVLG